MWEGRGGEERGEEGNRERWKELEPGLGERCHRREDEAVTNRVAIIELLSL